MAKLTNSTIYGSANITGNVVTTGQVFDISANSGINISNANTVSGVTITNTGSQYLSVPIVTFSNTTTGGVTANANAVMRFSGTIQSGNVGSGYANGDILYANVAGALQNAWFTVTSNTATTYGVGGINGISVGSYGYYFTIPSGSNAVNPYITITGNTSSLGAGANLQSFSGMAVNNLYFSNFGSGYVEQPTVTFSGGTPSTTATGYAIVGGQTIIKSLGTSTGSITGQSLMFQTPAGNALLIRDGGPATIDAHVMVLGTSSGYAQIMAEGTNSNASLYVGAKGTGSIRFVTNSTGLTEQFRVVNTTSAVNYLQATGATTANYPIIQGQGSDAAVGLIFKTKGNPTGPGIQFADGNGQINFGIRTSVASAVNYIQIQANPTGQGPVVSSAGSDTNIDLNLVTAGAGNINFRTQSSSNNYVQFRVSDKIGAVNYLQATGNTTSNAVSLSAQGSDTNVSMNLVSKGTGDINFIAANTVISGNVILNSTTNGVYTDNLRYAANGLPWVMGSGGGGGGSANIDQWVRDTANVTIGVDASQNVRIDYSNSAIIIIQGVNDSQNTRMSISENTDASQNVRLDYSNAAITIIQGVDVGQNTRLTVIENTDLSQNVRLDYSNTAIGIIQNIDLSQNTRIDYSNAAITIIQGTDTSQNARMTIIEGTDVSQNARMVIIENTDLSQNTRIDYSNAAITIIQGTDTSQNTRLDYSNAAITIVQGVDVGQNTRLTVIENTDLSQNVSISTQNSFITIIQGTDVGQNNRMTIIENTDVSQNVRLDYSNAAITIVQGVDTSQNARMTIIEGVDSTQNTNINNKLSLTGAPNQTVSGNVTISQDLIVSGNLIITGNVGSQNVQQLAVADPLIVLGIGNYTSDTKDIGFAAHYNDGVVNAHSGIIRDSGTKEYYVFKGYTPEVDTTNNVDINDASFSKANLNAGYFKGNLIATTAVVNGLDISSVWTTQNSRMTIIEGTNVSQNVRLDYSNSAITIVQGVDVSQNANIVSVQALANTDVTYTTPTAGSYGSSTLVPVVTIAANGRVTSITTTAVSGGSGGSSSGYLANSVIFANSTGYLSNTANIQFFEANNTLVSANTISAFNLVITGGNAGTSSGVGALRVAGGAYIGNGLYSAAIDTLNPYQINGTNVLSRSYLNIGSVFPQYNSSTLSTYDPIALGGIKTQSAIYTNIVDAGTVPLAIFNKFNSSNLVSAIAPVTYQNLATVSIDPPTWNRANTNITVSNTYSLWANGSIYTANNFVSTGNVIIGSTIAGTSAGAGALQVAGGAYFGSDVYFKQGVSSAFPFESTSGYNISGTRILSSDGLALGGGSLAGTALNLSVQSLVNSSFMVNYGLSTRLKNISLVTDTGTLPLVYFNKLSSSNVISSAAAVTYQNLATLVVDPPTWNIANTNITVSNTYSLYANGAIYSNTNIRAANTITAANLVLTGTTDSDTTGVGALQVAGGGYFGSTVTASAYNIRGAGGGYSIAGNLAVDSRGFYSNQSGGTTLSSLVSPNNFGLQINASSLSVGISSQTGTVSLANFNSIKGPKLDTSNSPVTWQNLTTLLLQAPTINVACTNITVSNTYALYANGAIYSNTNIQAANTFFAGSNGITFADGTKQTTAATGGSGSSSNSFSVIKISGQPDLIANTPVAQLTFAAGSGINFTTVGTSNTLTIASTGGFSGGTIANQLIVANTISSFSNSNNALQVSGGVGVANSVYVGNRVGFGNTSTSLAYTTYNSTFNSIDTIFG